MAEEEKEEILQEVEAVEAVYGHDCLIIQRFPPHLNLHIKPRTADDSSQQFVEAIICLQAGSQYPKEPPYIDIKESKGLDGKRQAHLLNCMQEKAHELSSYLMLVALCEEAVDTLSNMNHPDGDCPLCLYPLVEEETEGRLLPFMKLMSCYHCFHSDCIIRWWNWLQEQNESNLGTSSAANASFQQSSEASSSDSLGDMNKNLGICPVCRMVFHSKDIEHVLDLVGARSSETDHGGITGAEVHDDELLQSEAEELRRQKFDALLKLQEQNSGLIEKKKTEVLRPGVFLPVPPQSTKSTTTTQQTDPNRKASETGSSRLRKKASTNEHKNSEMRNKNRSRHHPREHEKKWIKKEIGNSKE